MWDGSGETAVDSDRRTGDDAGETTENPDDRAPLKSGLAFLRIRARFLYLLSELTDVWLRPAI